MSVSSEQILNKVIQLTSIEKFQGSSKSSIEVIQSKYEQIRQKFPQLKIITIGGTNGKGHVSYALEDLLTEAGYKVAKWSSPHLYSINERISLSHKPISNDLFYELIQKNENNAKSIKLSFYEFLFVCFCDYVLSLNHLDFIILEVGMGGRLDTTNLFDADLTALTSIGLDHTEFLGDNLKSILLEKVEISRKSRPHFSTISRDYLIKIEEDFIKERGAIYRNIFNSKYSYVEMNNILAKSIYLELVNHPQANSFDLEKKMTQLFLGPGRLEKRKVRDHEFTLNSTHNLDGFKALTKYIYDKDIRFDYIILSFANREEAEILNILQLVKTYPCRFDKILLTSFSHNRALSRREASRIAEKAEIPFVNYSEFLDTINSEKTNLKVLLTGSNYFLSEVHGKLSS